MIKEWLEKRPFMQARRKAEKAIACSQEAAGEMFTQMCETLNLQDQVITALERTPLLVDKKPESLQFTFGRKN